MSRYLKQKSDIIYGPDKNCHFEELYTKLVRDKDRRILEQWRKSKNKRKWEKAVVILESNNLSVKQISAKIERPVKVIQKWIRDYTNHGIESIKKDRKKRDRRNSDKKVILKTKPILEILIKIPNYLE